MYVFVTAYQKGSPFDEQKTANATKIYYKYFMPNYSDILFENKAPKAID